MFYAAPVFVLALAIVPVQVTPPTYVKQVAPQVQVPAAPTIQSLPVPVGVIDADMARLVTVPVAYQYGACQAIEDVAWRINWKFKGDCSKFAAVRALPLPFGQAAPASFWLTALIRQLPRAIVLADENDNTIEILYN